MEYLAGFFICLVAVYAACMIPQLVGGFIYWDWSDFTFMTWTLFLGNLIGGVVLYVLLTIAIQSIS